MSCCSSPWQRAAALSPAVLAAAAEAELHGRPQSGLASRPLLILSATAGPPPLHHPLPPRVLYLPAQRPPSSIIRATVSVHIRSGTGGHSPQPIHVSSTTHHRVEQLTQQPHSHSESACYYCTMEECEGAREENRYIRLHVAGTSEASVVRSDFTCLICGSALAEDVAFRTLSSELRLENATLRGIVTSFSSSRQGCGASGATTRLPELSRSPAPLLTWHSLSSSLSGHAHHTQR